MTLGRRGLQAPPAVCLLLVLTWHKTLQTGLEPAWSAALGSRGLSQALGEAM